MRFDPFNKVNCKYGSPMGRISRSLELYGTLAARHQGGGDGYDKGGAYWGTPSNVWAVWNSGNGPDTVVYVRANSRDDAMNVAIKDM